MTNQNGNSLAQRPILRRMLGDVHWRPSHDTLVALVSYILVVGGLFGLRLVFAAIFRLTKNVAVRWPFYIPVGGLYSTLSDGLTLPFEATYGFVLTLGLMVALVVVAIRPRSWDRGSTSEATALRGRKYAQDS